MTAKAICAFANRVVIRALPTLRTISNRLDRHGYRLRTVEKTKVQNKIAETDAIFEKVKTINSEADTAPETLRRRMDTKATVNIGEDSRNGQSRGKKPVNAWDHERPVKEKLVPGGLLEPVSGKTFLLVTSRYKTSDFMVDGLLKWWNPRSQELVNVKRLVVNRDHGPECRGRRTPFLRRMTEFVEATRLTVRLVY